MVCSQIREEHIPEKIFIMLYRACCGKVLRGQPSHRGWGTGSGSSRISRSLPDRTVVEGLPWRLAECSWRQMWCLPPCIAQGRGTTVGMWCTWAIASPKPEGYGTVPHSISSLTMTRGSLKNIRECLVKLYCVVCSNMNFMIKIRLIWLADHDVGNTVFTLQVSVFFPPL